MTSGTHDYGTLDVNSALYIQRPIAQKKQTKKKQTYNGLLHLKKKFISGLLLLKKYSFLYLICITSSVCSLLSGWTVRLVSPQFDPRLICDYIPGLNQAQRNVCKEVPEAMVTLTTAEDVFKGECEWQFKKDRWNCSDVEPPIFKDPELQG